MVGHFNFSRERKAEKESGITADRPMLNKGTKMDTLNWRTREHYTRDDLPCHCKFCDRCPPPPLPRTTAALSLDLSHLVLPDGETCRDYLEIFELDGFSGVVFTQTVLRWIRKNQRGWLSNRVRLDRRIRELTESTTLENVVFSNENNVHTYMARAKNSSEQQHNLSLIFAAAQRYSTHCCADAELPVVVVSSAADLLTSAQRAVLGENLQVLTMQQYLSQYHADNEAARDLLVTLDLMTEASKQKAADAGTEDTDTTHQASGISETEYTEHVPQAALKAGILSGLYVKGVMRVNKYQSQSEAFVTPGSVHVQKKVNSDDIVVHGMIHRNRAIHGDTVAIEVLPKAMWRKHDAKEAKDAVDGMPEGASTNPGTGEEASKETPTPTGRVVGVIGARGWRSFVATLDENTAATKGSKVIVVPMEPCIPKIRIATSNVGALANKRIVVRIDDWPVTSRWPQGHFVKVLGDIGDVNTETAAILIEHQISATAFSPGSLDELPKDNETEPWAMEEDEIAHRRDIRSSHLVFSIDPLGCEDVDDALCVKHLDNGNIELSVHIADVSYFVPTGSLTDREARARGTTVYMCDRRYDMLPSVLSANLCSLLADVDRYVQPHI